MILQINFSKKVVLFLAQKFTESSYQETIHYFSERGIEVSVIGLTREVIVGEDGLKVQPDYFLSQLEAACDVVGIPSGVVLGGGINCMNVLMADPRVHNWLTRFSSTGWRVGALRPLDYTVLLQLGQATLANLMIQNDTSYEVFLNQYSLT